ncbi:MAG: hypothetical protein Q9191_001935 [Dirinaria sp. TL-2023a]
MADLVISPKEPKTEPQALLPSRPGYGTKGRALKLFANYFRLNFKPGVQLHKYSIKILVKPELLGYRRKRRLIGLLLQDNFFREHHPTVATDYEAFLISPRILNTEPREPMHFQVKYFNELETQPSSDAPTYNLEIAYDRLLPLNELLDYLAPKNSIPRFDEKEAIIKALNAVVTQNANRDHNIISAGRNSKFFPLGNEQSLRGFFLVRRGYYASVRSTAGSLLVNLNACTSAFYNEMNLLDLMLQAKHEHIPWSQFLPGLRVSTRYLKFDEGPNKGQIRRVIKTIVGVGEHSSAKDTKFRCKELDNVNDVSVEYFFQKKHGITLQKAWAPLVDVRAPKATSPVWIPPELCEVLPHQLYRRVVPADLTSLMIKAALQPPREKAQSILGEGCQTLGIAEDQDDPTGFRLEVQPRMITVEARILDAPMVIYQAINPATPMPKAFQPTDGSWNLMGVKFSTVGKSDINWTFLSIGQFDNARFKPGIEQFKKALRYCGISRAKFNPQAGVILPKDVYEKPESASDAIRKAAGAPLDLLLVILPQYNIPLYSKIKYFADVQYGIHTVCAIAKNFCKPTAAYHANLTLKVNLKFGGVNQSLNGDDLGVLKDGKTMVIGYDVTHPSPTAQKNTPSIAGLVASIDGKYAQWAPSIRLQLKAREEMVKEPLSDMVMERLAYWQERNKSLPSKILVYRDGVSEGQYSQVLTFELPSIKAACQSQYQNEPLPKISILIVGKRHHTRMFTQDASGGLQGNPVPGTVLDQGITMEKGYNFFLQPHKPLKGTARPIHYVVVHDEIELGVDELQKTTHNLSYMYGRATKAVSVCPPAYFADLLCDRARCYLHSELNGRTSKGSVFDPRVSWNGEIHGKMQNTMFYI